MGTQKNNKIKNFIFPLSVFFLILFIEIAVVSGGISFYFYLTGKKNIKDIEKYTVNYSKTLAESFSKVAAFCYGKKNYSDLRELFHEKIESDTVDEAFFVLKNGKIMAHSNSNTRKKLRGNIANDEMYYNIEMIMAPLRNKNNELVLSNYNITDKKIPFNRKERELIKKYLFENINSNGWLFSKGVLYRGKPIGTVNFIIGKARIHQAIHFFIKKAKSNIAKGLFLSFFIALIISIYVMMKYIKRSDMEEFNQISQTKEVKPKLDKTESPDSPAPAIYNFNNGEEIPSIALESTSENSPIDSESSDMEEMEGIDEGDLITVEYLGELDESTQKEYPKKVQIMAQVMDPKSLSSISVKDAIPCHRREH